MPKPEEQWQLRSGSIGITFSQVQSTHFPFKPPTCERNPCSLEQLQWKEPQVTSPWKEQRYGKMQKRKSKTLRERREDQEYKKRRKEEESHSRKSGYLKKKKFRKQQELKSRSNQNSAKTPGDQPRSFGSRTAPHQNLHQE